MVFNSAGTADAHVAKRIDKCRRSFYALNDVGMGYPGCSASIKSYLWKTMCQPVLLYGLECFNLPGRCFKDLETCQGNLVKQSLGFSKRSRTSFTLQAMNVFKVVDCFKKSAMTLFNRVFTMDSPIRLLYIHFLSIFICDECVVPGSFIDRILSFNLSPVECAFTRMSTDSSQQSCGVTDSLKILLMHQNFLKPYSDEHIMAMLLTRSF